MARTSVEVLLPLVSTLLTAEMSTDRRLDLGSLRCSWLLKQRGCDFVGEDDLETKISVRGRRPDFYAWKERARFLVEVESFEGLSVLKTAAPRVAWIDPQRLAKRLDTAVRRAARQLGPYREEAIPLLVVLDNHRRVGLPLEPIDLIQLFGSVQVHASLDTLTGTVGPPQWQHGGGQTLSPRWRTYLSAIAVNLPKKGYAHVEPANAERPMRIRLLHNPYAIVPFPPDVFIDPEDHLGRFAMGKWTWWAGA